MILYAFGIVIVISAVLLGAFIGADYLWLRPWFEVMPSVVRTMIGGLIGILIGTVAVIIATVMMFRA